MNKNIINKNSNFINKYKDKLYEIKFFFLIGNNLAGKSTIIKKIYNSLDNFLKKNIFIFAIGEVLRKESQTNLEIKKLIDNGNFVKNEFILDLLYKKLKEILEKNNNIKYIIFDGFPRNIIQMEFLKNNFLKNIKYDFIFLEIDREVSLSRALKRGRIDDKIEIWKNRYDLEQRYINTLIEKKYFKFYNFLVLKNFNFTDQAKNIIILKKKIFNITDNYEKDKINEYFYLSQIVKDFWSNSFWLKENFNRLINKSQIEIFIQKFAESNNILTLKNFIIHGKKFPSSACISQNLEIAHSTHIINNVLIKDSFIRVDVVFFKNGVYIDSARTFPFNLSFKNKKFLDMINIAKELSVEVAKRVKIGDNINVITDICNKFLAAKKQFYLFEGFCGHRIGYNLHEEPTVYHFSKMNKNVFIEDDMLLCIEPIFSNKSYFQETFLDEDFRFRLSAKDGWSYVIDNDKLNKKIFIVHYENTILFRRSGNILLTKND